MINESDPVYKKHKDCPVVGKWIDNPANPKQRRMRMFCTNHNKWLHILTEKESQILLDQFPYDI